MSVTQDVSPPQIPADAPVAHTGHRMTPVDMAELEGWLVNRIVQHCPHKHPNAVRAWLYQSMSQNDAFFARAGGGVCLVQRVTPFLSKFPYAELIFSLATPGREADASGLFQDIANWCERQMITHIQLCDLCDVERADISMEIQTPVNAKIQIVRLPLWHQENEKEKRRV